MAKTKPEAEKKNHFVGVWLKIADWKRLYEHAISTGWSVSKVLRTAIDHYLDVCEQLTEE